MMLPPPDFSQEMFGFMSLLNYSFICVGPTHNIPTKYPDLCLHTDDQMMVLFCSKYRPEEERWWTQRDGHRSREPSNQHPLMEKKPC